MQGCFDTLEKAIPQLQSAINSKSPNELVSLPNQQLITIRDFSGNLALLCNMILNGEEYTEDDKKEGIFDETFE